MEGFIKVTWWLGYHVPVMVSSSSEDTRGKR